MRRIAIQTLFLLLMLGWFLFSSFMFMAHTLGDCGDVVLCEEIKKVSVSLVFWRWLAGSLILFGAYRFFRKDLDV